MKIKNLIKTYLIVILSLTSILSFISCSSDNMILLFQDKPELGPIPQGSISLTIIDSVYGTPIIHGVNIQIENPESLIVDTMSSTGTADFTFFKLHEFLPYTLTITHKDYTTLVLNEVLVMEDTDLGDVFLDPLDVKYESVSGVVHNTLDIPIAGANVTIHSLNGFISVNETTDALGNFSFHSIPVAIDPNFYTITVTASGYHPGGLNNVDVNISPPDNDVGIIYLESINGSSGNISGHIIDSVYGTDIAGATIDIVNWNLITVQNIPPPLQGGNFTSSPLNSGLYTVMISMAGYNDTTITDITVTGNVDLGDIQLVPTTINNGSLSGQVQDTFGVAVSGVTVNISNSNGLINLNTTTDVSGDFTFPTVPELTNDYTITVTMTGYNPTTIPNISVTNGTNTDAGIIYIQQTSGTSGIISGTTLDAINLSIVDGANIEITKLDSTVADVKLSDASGHFQSIVLSPGAYTLTITKAGYNVKVIPGVNVNGNVDLGDIYLDRTVINNGSLFGQVVDLDWNPVQGATVVFDNTAGTIPQSTTTDASGKFNFDAVPEGSNFILQVSKVGYFPTTKNNVTVNAGVANDAGIIFLAPTTASSGKFSGRVIDSYNGAPINGATVEIYDYNSILIDSKTSAANGTFSSVVLTPGSYTVIVKKTGYFDFVQDNKILDGDKELHDLPLCEILTGNHTRLYIVWAALPNDLDLHVVGPTSNASAGMDPPTDRFHVSFQTDGYYEDTGLYTSSTTSYTTSLVLDDIDGSGPETINLMNNYAFGNYNFTVHLADVALGIPDAYWYDGDYLPVARVYNSTGLVREIPFPSTPPASNAYYWKICRINKHGPGDTDITVTVPTANPFLFHSVYDYNNKVLMDWSF